MPAYATCYVKSQKKKNPVNEEKMVLGWLVFLSSFNVKFYASWHSVEAFSVISSAIESENQLITKN